MGNTVLEPPIRMLESSLAAPGERGPAWAVGGDPTTAEITDALPNLRRTSHKHRSKDKATEPQVAEVIHTQANKLYR